MTEIAYYYSPVELKYQLMSLLGLYRSHAKEGQIAVIVAGAKCSEFLTIIFTNLFNVQCCPLNGKQTKEQQENAMKRFNELHADIIFISITAVPIAKLSGISRLIWYDIPPDAEKFSNITKSLKPNKSILFLDPRFSGYLDKIAQIGIEIKKINFDPKKLPKELDRVINCVNNKSYAAYESSQFGYREVINAYVHHPNPEIFNALSLNGNPLVDISINFGITAPPKLPLTP